MHYSCLTMILLFILIGLSIFLPPAVGVPFDFLLLAAWVIFNFFHDRIIKPKERTVVIKDKRISEHTVFTEDGSSTREKFETCTVDYTIAGRKFVHTANCPYDIYKKLGVGKSYIVYIRSTEIVSFKKPL